MPTRRGDAGGGETPIAKLVRPQLGHAIDRPRLFSRLDQALSRTLTWLTGNAGAGKTTLVSTYAAARARPCLWYQIDFRDGDPGTFFYYLTLAARQLLPDVQLDLPTLGPEALPALGDFAHHYLERLFACLPRQCLLVFDNFQEAGREAFLNDLLGDGLAAAPPGINTVITSRDGPPPKVAHLRSIEAASVIDGRALALTVDEVRQIALARGMQDLSEQTLQRLHARTQGWAAGLTLLLEHEQDPSAPPTGGEGAVFDYFATELLQRHPPADRDILLRLAAVPRITPAAARALCPASGAERLLQQLWRDNFFLVRHADDQSYEFHPLLRAYLRQTARHHMEPERYGASLRLAAGILRTQNQIEDAVDLCIEAQDWPEVAGIVIEQAPGLLAQGRVRQLDHWITSIPEPLRFATPWLDYWFGVCRLGFDLHGARAAFERANAGFRTADDVAGRCLAAAGVVETYIYEWGDFRPLDRWIDEIDALMDTHARLLPEPARARVTVALFTAFMYRRPDHVQLQKLAQQVHHIIERLPDDLLRITAGSHLLLYYTWWRGELSKGGALVELLNPLAQSKRVSPLLQIAWLAIEATHTWMAGDTAHCIETAERGLELAERTGIHLWDFMLLAQAGWGALTSDNLVQARTYLNRMGATAHPQRLLDLCHYRYELFVEAMHRGDAAAMHDHSSAALKLAREAGVPWAEGIVLSGCARARAAAGQRAAAGRLLAQAGRIAERLGSDTIAYGELLARVELGLPRDGRTHALRRLLEISRRCGFINSSWWRASAMADVCTQALEAGIETDFVRELIERRGLLPAPQRNPSGWPVPVRIVTLGGFQLLRHGTAVHVHGKTQKKPLDLLKLLVALGGERIPEAQLADELWPDAEGDAQQQALATTLHRLRRLLGTDCISRQAGEIGLDGRRCDVDLTTLQAELGHVTQALESGCDDEALAAFTRVMAVYRGPLLPADSRLPSVLRTRERLHARLLRTVQALGDALLRRQRLGDAEAVFEHGLEIDDLCEACYRGLMVCHLGRNRRADGLAVYHRCRKTLGAVLGVRPAPDTEAVHHQLRTG